MTMPVQLNIDVQLIVLIHSSLIDFSITSRFKTEPVPEVRDPRITEIKISDSIVETRFIRAARTAIGAEEMTMIVRLKCMVSIILPQKSEPIVIARPEMKADNATSFTVPPI
jgi:hypothetical protein